MMHLRRLGSIIIVALIATSAHATDNYVAAKHAGQYPSYPDVKYGSGEQAKQIKRGEYLVKVGDCLACHTKHGGGQPFAGGLPIKTPFGTIYTPNITPDKTTGIGNWTDKQFITAMRDGINPQGKYYYPAFPYYYFNRITTKDLIAIKAYLSAIPAVKQQNHPNGMHFPFNWRFLQLGWRLLFFHFQKTGPYQMDPTHSASWNRGKYLVDSLGHCSMCHTTSHHLIFKKWSLAAPIKKYYLAGAMVEGFYAPNITSTLLEGKPVQELEAVFKKDKLIGGGEVQGPMAEANHDSLKYLHEGDIQAIDDYLKTVVSEAPPKPSAAKGLAGGKKIYETYCQGCHTTGAGGALKLGDAAEWDPVIKKGMNTLYRNAITGIGGMPPKGTCTSCTTAEIQAAVQYIVSQVSPGTARTLGHSKMPPAPKKLTLADGKEIYDRSCSACHSGNYPGAPKVGDTDEWQKRINKGMDILLIHAINGYKNHPKKGSCHDCTDAQVIAAVKYMVHESKVKGDYQLW